MANPYMFNGRRLDPETGLYYYRARYYDPQSGRFISEDPLGFASKGVNLYEYVSANPINFVDPSGLQDGDLEKVREQFQKTPEEVGSDIARDIAKKLLEKAAPKSKGPIMLGELAINIGILIFNELTESEEHRGKLEVKAFKGERRLKIKWEVKDILRKGEEDCLGKLKPRVRKELRRVAEEERREVLYKLGDLADALASGGSNRARHEWNKARIKLEQRRDFLYQAMSGPKVLGE